MNKGLEVDVEMGLCTKEMAKENPIKDFEILIEEHKGKWSEQMYEYFKECLNEIKNEHKRLEELEKEHNKLLWNYQELVHCGAKSELKKIKALEVIEEHFEISKPVGIDIESNQVSCGCLVQKKVLTLDEYYLLKGILL